MFKFMLGLLVGIILGAFAIALCIAGGEGE
jgi:hypothetical protein